MWKLLIPALLLLGGVVLTTLSDRPQPSSDFRFINKGDVSTLDVQRASWQQDLRVIRSLHEGLVHNDTFSRDMRVVPGVAERWDISDDRRTYTFHLRTDAKWSNAEPVRASDFVFSWRRGLLIDTACDYTGMFQLIKGGKAFYQWREVALKAFRPGVDDADELWARTQAEFERHVGLGAPDDRTFVVTLERPTPYFLDLCAFAVFYPVYAPLVSAYETPNPRTGRLEARSGWTKPGVNVTNGPFMLDTWRFKRDMRLIRNPHYWNARAINIDSVLMPTVEDPNAAVLAFESGTVDFISDVTVDYRSEMLAQRREFLAEHRATVQELEAQGVDPLEIARRLPADPRNRIHPLPAFGTYFYNFNCLPKLADGRDNPFADRRVRRAFSMAVDKQRIVQQVRRTGEPAIDVLIPPGSIPGYRSPRGLPYDPPAARALLAEAGFPGGKGFITVEILFNKDAGHDKIAETIKKDWEVNLGVNVTLRQREIKVFRNDLKNQNYMVSRASWFGDYGDPTTFLDLNRKDDGNNDRKYADPEFEAILDRAQDQTDPAARMRLLEQAEQIIVERDLPLIPLFQYVELYLYDPHKLTGISSHPRQEQNIFAIDMLGDGKGADQPRFITPAPVAPSAPEPRP